MFKNFFKLLRMSTPLLVAPVLLPTAHCLWGSKFKQNEMKSRVHIGVQVSNKPCEDRSAQLQLRSIQGYATAVYDGHGGWQVSHLCSKILLQKLDEMIFKNKSKIQNQQELIQTSLRQAFQEVEQHFLKTAREGYKLGFGRMARAGSCALVCVVANNKVYSANAGDSFGLLIQKNNNKMSFTELNRQLNANKQYERQRLKRQFPHEQDIVICKRQNMTACYVKGRLQPTRSLGDLRLKHPEFNNPQSYSTDHDYQSQLKTFTGPYISWEPQIKVFDLKKNHKCLIMASDGLWDQLQSQEVTHMFKSNAIEKMPSLLIQRTLEKAAQSSDLTVESIRSIPAGKKRKIHDDITIVIVDLQKQYKG